MIVLAAIFPVLGGGIRILRSAHESTRNKTRFRAKQVALHEIEQRLRKNPIANTADAEDVFRDLWCSEQILESEHREWLRLMLDAEWIG